MRCIFPRRVNVVSFAVLHHKRDERKVYDRALETEWVTVQLGVATGKEGSLCQKLVENEEKETQYSKSESAWHKFERPFTLVLESCHEVCQTEPLLPKLLW